MKKRNQYQNKSFNLTFTLLANNNIVCKRNWMIDFDHDIESNYNLVNSWIWSYLNRKGLQVS